MSCPLLTSYVTGRDSWLSLVLNTVNKALANASASAEEPASREKAPPTHIGRKKAENLFIWMLVLGGFGEWSKDVGYIGSIPKVDGLRLELKRIEKPSSSTSGASSICFGCGLRHRDMPSKNPLSKTLCIIMKDIENRCLMAAIAYIQTKGLGAAVLVYDKFMVHDPDQRICAEDMI